jgi:hypothetical protein
VGKIAEAFVEIGGRDSAFRESVQKLESIMQPLGKNAERFARGMDAAADHSGGIFSSVLSGAATALRAYAAVMMANRAYSLASRLAGTINPFAGVKTTAVSVISSGFKAISSGVGSIVSKFGLVASSLGAIGVAGVVAVAAVAALAIAAGGIAAISVGIGKASDLAEQVDFSKIVMGDVGFDQASKAAESLSNQFGILRKDTLNVATTSASMAKNLGFTKEEATGLGISVAQLATDLSSAANTSFPQAAGAIQSLFRGESDPIERFGVTITEAAVEAEALSSGLAKSKDQIDATVKFQARWNLLIKQTADSQGNLNKTASSFANVMRNVKGQAQEALTTLGESFMPIAGTFARLALVSMTFMRRLAEGFDYLSTPIKYLANQVNMLSDSLMGLTGIDPKKFSLFSGDPVKDEAKKVKRFTEELAAEKMKKAQDLADFELKKKHGLLTDVDKEKAGQAGQEELRKKQQETETAAKRMADLQRQEVDLIEKKKEKEDDYTKAMNKTYDEHLKKQAELEATFERERQRKAEDAAIDAKRRQEDRNASFNLKSGGEAADMLFTAAMDKGREDKRGKEDTMLEEQRKKEDMAREIRESAKAAEAKRAELNDEKKLTDEQMAKEIDKVVVELKKIYAKFDMRMA